MSQNGSLSQKQSALLGALVSGQKIEAAAKSANVAIRTAYRWQKLPAFQESLKAAQDAVFDKQLAMLKSGMGAALSCLARNMSEKVPPAVQVSAARFWLEQAIDIHKMHELEAKIGELERLLKQEGLKQEGQGNNDNIRRFG